MRPILKYGKIASKFLSDNMLSPSVDSLHGSIDALFQLDKAVLASLGIMPTLQAAESSSKSTPVLEQAAIDGVGKIPDGDRTTHGIAPCSAISSFRLGDIRFIRGWRGFRAFATICTLLLRCHLEW
tara:strand:+ start:850 stop:1227 length:378 start_codon:yes stop_codon:yes gene_type:complete